jgi:hypothetical protein
LDSKLRSDTLRRHIHASWHLWWLSIAHTHAEVHTWPGWIVSSGLLSCSVIEVRLSGKFISFWCSRLLLSFHVGVFDVDSIFVDVSLLMVGPKLSVSISFDKNIVVVSSNSDIVVEFLDVFIVELVEEVDDKSSGNFVDLYPRRMNCVFFRLCDSFGLVTINFEESLGLYDVKAEVVILSDWVFFSRSYCFD